MNKYRVDLSVEIDVEANSKEEAEKKAYESIGNMEDDYGIEFESYTVFENGVKLIDSNIEEICFTCNKRGVGGSNDKQCPKCFAEWEKGYNERHKDVLSGSLP